MIAGGISSSGKRNEAGRETSGYRQKPNSLIDVIELALIFCT